MTGNDIHGIAYYNNGIGWGVVCGPVRFWRRLAHQRCVTVTFTFKALGVLWRWERWARG